MPIHRPPVSAAALLAILSTACSGPRSQQSAPPPVSPVQPSDASSPSQLYTIVRGGVAPYYWASTAVGAKPKPAVRVTPASAAAYGVRAADVRIVAVSPDDKLIVVRAGDALFAAPTDGSRADAPVRIANARYPSDVEFSPDGRWIAWVDEKALHAAPVDGSRADKPGVVARHDKRWRFERPRWQHDSLAVAFLGRQHSPRSGLTRTFIAARDGSEADAPRDLTRNKTGQHLVQRAVPGGLLTLVEGRHLWLISPQDGRRIAQLTSELTSIEHVFDDGRILLELAGTSFRGLRKLAVVTLTGTKVSTKYLTGKQVYSGALVAPDGRGLAYVSKFAGGFAVFVRTSVDGSPRRISATAPQPPSLLSFEGTNSGAPWIQAIEDRGSGAMLKYPLDGTPTTRPTTIDTEGHVIADDGASTIRLTSSRDGLVTARKRLSVAKAKWRRPADPYSKRISGAVLFRDRKRFAIAATAIPHQGEERLLTGWSRDPIVFAQLVGDAVVYSTGGDRAAWYSVPLDGSGPTRQLTENGTAGNLIGVGKRSLLIALVHVKTRIVSVPLDGEMHKPALVTSRAVGAWQWLPSRRELVYSGGGAVRILREKGTVWWSTPLVTGSGDAELLAYDPRSRRVIAVTRGPKFEQIIHSIPLDQPKAAVVLGTRAHFEGQIVGVQVEMGRVLVTVHKQQRSFTAVPPPPIEERESFAIDAPGNSMPLADPVAAPLLEPSDAQGPTRMAAARLDRLRARHGLTGPFLENTSKGHTVVLSPDGRSTYEVAGNALVRKPAARTRSAVAMTDRTHEVESIACLSPRGDFIALYAHAADRRTVPRGPSGHAYSHVMWIPAELQTTPHAPVPASKHHAVAVVGCR